MGEGFVIQLLFAAQGLPASLGGGKSDLGAFNNDPPLQMCDRSQNVKGKFTKGGAGFQIFAQAFQSDAMGPQVIIQIQQIL